MRRKRRSLRAPPSLGDSPTTARHHHHLLERRSLRNILDTIDALVRLADTPPTVLAVQPFPVAASGYLKPDLLSAIRAH